MATATSTATDGRVALPLRVPPAIRRRAKAAAGAADVSMNEHLIAVLDAHLPQLHTDTTA